MKIRLSLPLVSESKKEKDDKDWFSRKSKKAQEDYIKQHKTKKKKTNKDQDGDKDETEGKNQKNEDIEDPVEDEEDESSEQDAELKDDEDSGEPVKEYKSNLDEESQAYHERAVHELTHHKRESKRLDQNEGHVHVDVPDAHIVEHQQFVEDIGVAPDHQLVPAEPKEVEEYHEKVTDEQLDNVKDKLKNTSSEEICQAFLPFYKNELKQAAGDVVNIGKYAVPAKVRQAAVVAAQPVIDKAGKYLSPVLQKSKELSAPIINPIANVAKYIANPVANKARMIYNFVNGQVVGEDPDFEQFKKSKQNKILMANLGVAMFVVVGGIVCPGLPFLAIPLGQMLMEHFVSNMDKDPEERQKEVDSRRERMRRREEAEEWERNHPSLDKSGQRKLSGSHPVNDDDDEVAVVGRQVVSRQKSQSSDANFSPDGILSENDRRLLLYIIDHYKEWVLKQDLKYFVNKLEKKHESRIRLREQGADTGSVRKDSGQDAQNEGLQ